MEIRCGMESYRKHLTISRGEANLAILKDETLNERKASIVKAEMNLYYQKELALLMRWYKDKNMEERELEKALKETQFLILFLEYVRLQEIIQLEKTLRSQKKPSSLINRVATIIGNMGLFAMGGALTANVLRLLGLLYTVVVTAVAYVGGLAILALALPASLSAMILGVGIDLVNAIFHKKTPERSTVIGSNILLIGLASTALMVPLGLVPAAIMGFPIVLSLLFTGMVVVSYYKDKKHFDHNENQISINDRIIEHNENLLIKHFQILMINNQVDFENPTIQRLSVAIAEAKRENELLKIQCQTLSKVRNTHRISLVAVGILLVSALVFPPLSVPAAIAGVVGLGLFLGMSLYSKKLRDGEKELIKDKEKEMTIGAIQMVVCENTMKKIPKKILESKHEELKNDNTRQEIFNPGKLFEKDYMSEGMTIRMTEPEVSLPVNGNESIGLKWR
jgi:hypothetical protein